MKWDNLKNYKCPSCSAGLFANTISRSHACPTCGFRISEEKFNQIVAEKYKPYTPQGDNLEALNNLGHNPITEDFSDSPYADRQPLEEDLN